MSFFRYITVLEALTMHETGATRGQAQKLCLDLSRGQIERTLKELVGEGFVREEKVPYRAHIEKKLYHIEEKAIEYCELIVTKYDRMEQQKELPMGVFVIDVIEQIDAVLEGQN